MADAARAAEQDENSPVEHEDVGTVRWLTLNRPEKLNALDHLIRVELDRQFRALEDRPDISVVVLRGNGRSFSGGADIATPAPGTDAALTWTTRRHEAGVWQRLLDLLERLPQVTVASLHGHCYGGAALLAASCDIRVADETLRVRIPEVAMGIPLTWAGVPRLVREIGLPMARDLVMTGRILVAQEALTVGFVQRLVASGQLATATAELVDELTSMTSAPLAMTRAMFAAITRDQLSATGWADPDLLAWSLREPEAVDAAIAYVEERRAR